MMKNFKETSIPEQFSKAVLDRNYMVGASNVYKIVDTLFRGVSTCLGSIKDTNTPKSIVFRSIDGRFICAASVQYFANESDPNNTTAGRWDYTWTTNEEDIANSVKIEMTKDNMIQTYFENCAVNKYGMKFAGGGSITYFMTLCCELIIKWCQENATATEEAILNMDGVFKATGKVADDICYVGIVPSGEMKVIIKDDSAIQE